MKITIDNRKCQPVSRVTKNGDVRWSQPGFAHLGGIYPVEIGLPIPSAADAYPEGDYVLSTSSYRVNQFGGLEIHPFQMTLEPEQDKKPLTKTA